jgi:hypothetical protein
MRPFPKARPRKTGAESTEEAGSRQMLQREREIGNKKTKKGKEKHLRKILGNKIAKKRLNSVKSSEEKPEGVRYAELSDDNCASLF